MENTGLQKTEFETRSCGIGLPEQCRPRAGVRMSANKWAGAIVAAFVIVVATNWFVHGFLLRAQYQMIALSFRPFEQIRARMWLVLVGEAIFSVQFVYAYVRGLEQKMWLGQGMRYAVVIWGLAVIPASLAEYTTQYIPPRLALEWMVAGLVQLALAGAVVAAIVGEPERVSVTWGGN
jgi:hypothetical protein